MPLLHGKQIQNSSVILNKLSGTGSLVLQTGATLQLPTVNITNPTDVVNKEYVDNVAAGMNPHAAVKTATTGNLALATATASPVISGYTVSTNDRILVWQQSITASNGIYVYNGSTFSRAADMDGQPNTEVSVGDYTFVISGNYAGNGYVVVSSGTYSGVLEPIDVAPIVWSQFTGPGQFTWGNGLMNAANVIDVDIAANSGLTFSATQLTIASTIAGNGLAWSSGVLSVNTANGIQISGGNVQLSQTVAGAGLTYNAGVIDIVGGTGISIAGDAVNIANTGVAAGSYGAANSINTFSVNAQGQLTTAGTVSISITSGQVSNFTASVQALASTVTAGTGITVSSSNGNATVSIANTGVAAGSYGAANSINTFTVNAQGQLTTAGTTSISITSGQVTNFTASAISSALASANFVDSNTIDFTANGATVSAIVIAGSLTASHLNSNGGATAGYILSVAPNGTFNWITNDIGDITDITAGVGLTGGGSSGAVTLTVRATNGLNANVTSDSVELGGTLTSDTTVSGATLYDMNITDLQSGQVSIDSNTGYFLDRTGGVDTIRIIATAAANTTNIVVDAFGLTPVLDLNPSGGEVQINNRAIKPNFTAPTNGQALVWSSGDSAYIPQTIAGDISGVTAGAGLTGGGASGYVTLDVNTNNGLSIVNDAVVLGGTLSQTMTTISANNNRFEMRGLTSASTQAFAVETSDNLVQLYVGSGNNSFADYSTTGYIQVETNGGGMYLNGPTGNKYNRLFGGLLNTHLTLYGQNTAIADGSTNNSMVVRDSANSKGLVYHGDYTANFTTYSLVTKQYVDQISAGLGDITGVTAGLGLNGGGASGYVTLDINTGTGITISSDAVTLADTAVTLGSYGSATQVSTFTVDQQGRLTAAGNTSIAIPSTQVTDFNSQVATLISGTFGTPIYTQRNLAPVATTGNGASSSLTLTSTPKSIVNVSVYVNGQLQFLGNGTTASVDCYFGTQSATAKNISSLSSGDTLFWNGTYVGYDLATTDKVDIIYNA